MFGHRVQAMQVANGYGEGIDPSRRYECPRAVRRRKRLAYLGVVDGLGMDAGAATEVVRFALHACARGLRVLDDLASGRDDLLVGRVPLRLAQVNMNELEPGIDRRFGGFHARRMIQVDVHLDAEFDHIIVNHRTEIAQAGHLDLAMARLHEDRALPRRGGSGDRGERFLVVDVEGAEGKAFLPRPGVEGASGFSIGHEKTSLELPCNRQLSVLVDLVLDPLLLQAAEEGLGDGIIPAVALPAQTRLEAIRATEPAPRVTAVLGALVGVNQRALRS